ncbi:MAG: Vps62-related protein [Actinomycetota bacterium]
MGRRSIALLTLVALIATMVPTLSTSAPAQASNIPEYWRTYAPRVFFDPQERYLPTSVEHIIDNAILRSGLNHYHDLTIDSPELAEARSHDALLIAESAWGGMDPVAHPELGGHMLSEAPMYVTQYTNPDTNTIDITYWMIYAYNGCALAEVLSLGAWWMFWQDTVTERFEWCPGGVHQGDIERVRVSIDADTREPLTITYRAHSEETTYAWNEVEKTGTHPHVYPGLNSHANYHREGVHMAMSSAETNMFRAAYNLIHSGGLWMPGVGPMLLAFRTVLDVVMVDVNNASATIANPPNRDRVVWEPWQHGEGLVAVESGVGIWDYPGQWGPDETNVPLDWLSSKRNNSHIELNAMKWLFELAMSTTGQRKVPGPEGPLHKTDVLFDDVVVASAPIHGEVTLDVDGEQICVGEECETTVVDEEVVTLTANYDPQTEFFDSWLGACADEDSEQCALDHSEIHGITGTGALIDKIGLSVEGPGPTGFVSVYADDGSVLCDHEEMCHVDGVVGDTFTVEAHLDTDDGLGIEFTGWSDLCDGQDMTCEVTLTAPIREMITAEVAMPKVTVPRTLDWENSSLWGGASQISEVSGATTLELEMVGLSSDSAIFEMTSAPTTIRGDRPNAEQGADSATIETMRLEIDRAGVYDGVFDGDGTGQWTQHPALANPFTRDVNWEVDGLLDWDTADLLLTATDDQHDVNSGTFAYTPVPMVGVDVDGPSTVDVFHDGELVDTVVPNALVAGQVVWADAAEIDLVDTQAEVPDDGWALAPTPDPGVRHLGWTDETGQPVSSLALDPFVPSYVGSSFDFDATAIIDSEASQMTGKAPFDPSRPNPEFVVPVETTTGQIEVDGMQGGLGDGPLRATASFSEYGWDTTLTMELDDLSFSVAPDGTLYDVDVVGTRQTQWAPHGGVQTGGLEYGEGRIIGNQIYLSVAAIDGMAPFAELVLDIGPKMLEPATIDVSTSGVIELWRDGQRADVVDSGSRAIELQSRELQVQLTTDLEVARNAPLALYADTVCWCVFDGWSGEHNGTGDGLLQLEPAQVAAIGADFTVAESVSYDIDPDDLLISVWNINGERTDYAGESATPRIDAPVVGSGPQHTAAFASSEGGGVVVDAQSETIETRIGANFAFTLQHELVIDELVIAKGPNPSDIRVVDFDATFTSVDQITEPVPSEPERYEFAVDEVEITLDRTTGEIRLRLLAPDRHADLILQPTIT